MIKPFPYQQEGIEFLANRTHALLADEMGLGKTIQAVLAAVKIKAKRIHIICPAVAMYNWQTELLNIAGLKSRVDREGLVYETDKIVITSFEYAGSYTHCYRETPFDLMIVDEAHFLKNPEAKRTKAILGKKGLIHNAKRTWFLSGTPAPNHAGEVWTMLYTFGLTTLSYQGFISRYCNVRNTGGRYNRVEITGSNTKHTPELKKVLKECSLRRLKRNVLDLPAKFHSPYYVQPDTDAYILKQFPELKEKLDEEFQILSEKMNFDLIDKVPDDKLLNVLNLIAQSISSLRRYHGLRKVRPTAELIHEELIAESYKKLIVFGYHSDVLRYLQEELEKNHTVVSITGKTPPLERKRAVEGFQSDPSIEVFIGQIQAAGTAITLTAANQVIFIEQDWVPGNNAQAVDRAHRIGQKEPVTARHITIANSLDEKITTALIRKAKEISTFIYS